MGIFDALSTAVSGLGAQSYALQNISGNIANSQTTAFKRINTQFTDLMGDNLPSKQITALVIMAFAVVQIVVHMIYFLHMNTKSENGWSMMALIFTIVMVVIALSGSLWVMNHLNSNMMPMHEMTGMK